MPPQNCPANPSPPPAHRLAAHIKKPALREEGKVFYLRIKRKIL